MITAQLNELGVVQAPPSVSEENYATLANSIFGQQVDLPEREWAKAQIPHAIQRHSEVGWFHRLDMISSKASPCGIHRALRVAPMPRIDSDVNFDTWDGPGYE